MSTVLYVLGFFAGIFALVPPHDSIELDLFFLAASAVMIILGLLVKKYGENSGKR